MAIEYRAIPFVATASDKENAAAAAVQQFENILRVQCAAGFEYYRMDHFTLIQQPGCLAALFGAKPTLIQYDVLVFRRGTA